jgi:phospholipid transport system substrate-binding protein
MSTRLSSLSLVVLLAMVPAAALAAQNEPVVKPVRTVVQSVRYGKDLLALKQFAGEEQGRFLLGDAWVKGSEAQRKEFVERFQELFAKVAFPRVRDSFKNLASITYEDPRVEGERAQVASTVVIDHPMKKQELKLKYTLAQDKAGWKVLDVAVLGDSMLTGIRDDQVQPLLKEGGWDAVLAAMRAKSEELKGVTLK